MVYSPFSIILHNLFQYTIKEKITYSFKKKF